MRPSKALSAAAVLALCAATLLLPSAAPADEGAEAAATAAAQSWLAAIDAGEYGKSWDESAPLFQGAVAREQWIETLRAVRGPLGDLRSRAVRSAQFAKTLPGAPDGEYVVIQFEASFEKKENAIETVTPMMAPDGVWRVSGYYVK